MRRFCPSTRTRIPRPRTSLVPPQVSLRAADPSAPSPWQAAMGRDCGARCQERAGGATALPGPDRHHRRMPRSDAIWQHALQRFLPLPLRQDAREPALRAIANVTNPSIGRAGSGHAARIDKNLSPLIGYRGLVRYFAPSCADSLLHCATHVHRDAPYMAPEQYRPLHRASTLSSRLRTDCPWRRIDGPADRAMQAAVPQKAGRDA